MKTRAQLLAPGILVLWILIGAICNAQTADSELAQENKAQKPSVGLRLPPGMAPADDEQKVAALYSERHEKRVKAIRENTSDEERLTPQEAYTLKLIAYRTQLVEEQRQRKIKEIELQIERESRLLAEERAAELERQKRRESIYIQHHTVHAYQRNLNDEYWREQRLLRALEKKQHCHPPTPCPAPSPAPAPASSAEESSGDVLP